MKQLKYEITEGWNLNIYTPKEIINGKAEIISKNTIAASKPLLENRASLYALKLTLPVPHSSGLLYD